MAGNKLDSIKKKDESLYNRIYDFFEAKGFDVDYVPTVDELKNEQVENKLSVYGPWLIYLEAYLQDKSLSLQLDNSEIELLDYLQTLPIDQLD